MDQMLLDCILGRSMWSRQGTTLVSEYYLFQECEDSLDHLTADWTDWSQQRSNSSLQNVSPTTCYNRHGCRLERHNHQTFPTAAEPSSDHIHDRPLVQFCSRRGLKFRRKRNIFLLPKPNQAVTLNWAVCIKCGKMVKYGTRVEITEI